MEYCLLPQEIIEHILQFVDAQTLLTCREVSPQFERAVDVVKKKFNWHHAYVAERGDTLPFGVLAKLYPHDEGPKCDNWMLTYELCCKNHLLFHKEPYRITGIQLKKYSCSFKKILTHGDLIIALIEYNRNHSIFYRISVIDSSNKVMFRTHKLKHNSYYITPVKDASNLREDVIDLKCHNCNLKAIPLSFNYFVEGFPIIEPVPTSVYFKVITTDEKNVLWFDFYEKFIDKGDCFYLSEEDKDDNVDELNETFLKLYPFGSRFKILYKDYFLNLNTFKSLNSHFTVTMFYSNLLIAGTDTGMLYLYNNLDVKDKMKNLNLKNYTLKIDVCSEIIIDINVMELPDKFIILCCGIKRLFQVNFNRYFEDFACF